MYVMDPREQLRIMDEIDGLGRRPARDLPLAHALGGLPLAHRRRAGLLPRHALPDRVDRRPRRARDPRLPHPARRARRRADRRGAGGDRVRGRSPRSCCACAVAGRRVRRARPTTRPPTATTATAPAPAPTAPSGDLAALLPPQDAVERPRGRARRARCRRPRRSSTRSTSSATRRATPRERRLEEGGYADGVLRDQAGEDPEGGAALVRSYVIRCATTTRRARRSAAAVDEVAASSLGDGDRESRCPRSRPRERCRWTCRRAASPGR